MRPPTVRSMRAIVHMSQLIDSDGRTVPCQGGVLQPTQVRGLQAQLLIKLSGRALIDHVVNKLGWIEFDDAPRGFSIRCRPNALSQVALAALFYRLYDAAPARIALSLFGDEWSHSIHRSAYEVSTIIGSMSQAVSKHGHFPQNCFLKRAVPECRSSLQHGVQQVLQRRGSFSTLAGMMAVIDPLLEGRWTVSHCVGDAVVVDGAGKGFVPFNPVWLQQAEGQTLDHFADANYGAWVADARRDAARRSEPLYEELDALVHFPRLGETRLRYARCLLPLTLEDGTTYVITASRSNSGIDLRSGSAIHH
jgi:hypothetical protein